MQLMSPRTQQARWLCTPPPTPPPLSPPQTKLHPFPATPHLYESTIYQSTIVLPLNPCYSNHDIRDESARCLIHHLFRLSTMTTLYVNRFRVSSGLSGWL